MLGIGGNFNHGSYLSGEHAVDKREALTLYPQYQKAGYFQSLAELIALDRQTSLESDAATACLSDFLASTSIRARCHFASRQQQA